MRLKLPAVLGCELIGSVNHVVTLPADDGSVLRAKENCWGILQISRSTDTESTTASWQHVTVVSIATCVEHA